MAGVTELALQYFPSIIESSKELMAPLEGKIGPLRDKLVSSGEVKTYAPADPAALAKLSLATVDGANASDQMLNGDIFLAAASLGEGYHTQKLHYEKDDYPTFLYGRAIEHNSDNPAIIGGVRAFLEIQVLGAMKHDIRVIDGAYLGNVISVFKEAINHRVAVELLVNMIDDDPDGYFLKGLDRILDPGKHTGFTIALSKSDSSDSMRDKYFTKEDNIRANDRRLMSMILKPNEILKPEITGRGGYQLSVARPDINGNLKTKWSQIKDPISAHQMEQLHSMLVYGLYGLDANGNPDEDTFIDSKSVYLTTNQWVYSTYMKPKYDTGVVLRCEFTYNTSNAYDSHFGSPEAKAHWLAGIIDSDFIDASILEPFSQYAADLRVKQISPAMPMLRSGLVANSSPEEAYRYMNNYRT